MLLLQMAAVLSLRGGCCVFEPLLLGSESKTLNFASAPARVDRPYVLRQDW